MTDRGRTDNGRSRVDEELAGLAGAHLAGDKWPSESEIRSRSMKLHRRRVAMSGFGAVVLLVAIAVTSASLVGGPSTPHQTTLPTLSGEPAGTHVSAQVGSAVELTSLAEPAHSQNSTDEQKIATAEEEFSLKILDQLLSGSSTGNQLVSPFSLAEALTMAQLGARGETATQLAKALGVNDLSASDQASGWASLDEDLVSAAAHDHISLKSANSVWTQKGFPVKAPFLESLKSEFGAGVWQADFANDPAAAIRSINAWVSQATDGQIPTLLQPGDAPPSTAAVLLNAVLFDAQWATQLARTQPGEFYAPSGRTSVTYMSPEGTDSEFPSSIGPNLDAVQLPYWNGSAQNGNRPSSRYAALLLMPTSGSLSHFVSTLDAGSLRRIVSSMSNQTLTPSIPECKIGSTLQLAPALQALGVTDAFGPEADFSGLSSIATQITAVKQEATLKVTKWGTVASAATAVVAQASAARINPLTVTFNRPFLFLIRDTKTGAILFESAVNNPAAA
jgi:serpin B